MEEDRNLNLFVLARENRFLSPYITMTLEKSSRASILLKNYLQFSFFFTESQQFNTLFKVSEKTAI